MLSDSCFDLCYKFGLYSRAKDKFYANRLKQLRALDELYAAREFRESIEWYSNNPYDYDPKIIDALRNAVDRYDKGEFPVSHLILIAECARITYDLPNGEELVLLEQIRQLLEAPVKADGPWMGAWLKEKTTEWLQ